MPKLYGQNWTRRTLRERGGAIAQFAGVRLVELGDGAERGVRALSFRTGSGLCFTVVVDRAFDIADCEHKGRAIGWRSPTGLRHPGLHEVDSENGNSFLRSFSGLLVTCGLDHTGVPQEVPADTYGYANRKTMRHPLHGRVTSLPATLTGYGETWLSEERCVLWAEGIVVQAAMFGENLALYRRIEADLGGDEIRITDRVVNEGFARTPHMIFYHVNVGYPVLDEDARVLLPVQDVTWASHGGERYRAQGVGWRTQAAPQNPFTEQVWQHELGADGEGWVPAALVNDRLGVGFEVSTRKTQLPSFFQWQNLQAGHYVMGLEPSSHHVLGDLAARERGEMIWLEHGEARAYDVVFRVLDGEAAIRDAQTRVDAIAQAPGDEFAEPSGRFPPLRSG